MPDDTPISNARGNPGDTSNSYEVKETPRTLAPQAFDRTLASLSKLRFGSGTIRHRTPTTVPKVVHARNPKIQTPIPFPSYLMLSLQQLIDRYLTSVLLQRNAT